MQKMDVAETSGGSIGESRDLVALGYVGNDGLDGNASIVERYGCSIERFGLDITDDDVGTLLAQTTSDGQAYARCSSGDYSGASLEVLHPPDASHQPKHGPTQRGPDERPLNLACGV